MESGEDDFLMEDGISSVIGGGGGGGSSGGIGAGIGPSNTGDYIEESPVGGYSLCLNDSLINITLSSIFCSKNFSYPNYGENDFKEGMDLERIVSVVVPALFGVIFVVGLVGNGLVVLVVASNAQMRNTTNILIINLAIADLLFIIFCVPFTAADYVLTYWPFGLLWCKTVQYLIIVTAYVSVYTLVIMSVDRFLAVVYPVASISIRTEANTYLAIAITWAIVLISCLPVLSAHGLTFYEYAYESHAACTFNQEYNHAAFQISFMLTSYAIPLAIICLLYFGMLFRLWKSVSAAGSSGRSLRGKKRVTRMIVVVVGVFAVCWLPIQVVLLLKSLKLYEITDLSVAIQITSHVLGYMNSCVNPLIYSVLSENFRKAFRKVIQCRRHSPSPHTKPRPSTTHHGGPDDTLPLRRPSCMPPGSGGIIGGNNGNNGRNHGHGHNINSNESGSGVENVALLLQETHVVAFATNNGGTTHTTSTTTACLKPLNCSNSDQHFLV